MVAWLPPILLVVLGAAARVPMVTTGDAADAAPRPVPHNGGAVIGAARQLLGAARGHRTPLVSDRLNATDAAQSTALPSTVRSAVDTVSRGDAAGERPRRDGQRVEGPKDGPIFEVLSGAQYCAVSGDGSCVTDGPGDYGNDELCVMRIRRRTFLHVVEFAVLGSPWSGDRLTVDGVDFHTYPTDWGTNPLPHGHEVAAGTMLRWKSNYHKTSAGFTICGGDTLQPTKDDAQPAPGLLTSHLRQSSSETAPKGNFITSCGSHISFTGCTGCPQGNGAAWCNGECAWDYTTTACVGASPVSPPPGIAPPAPIRASIEPCTMEARQQFSTTAIQGRRFKRAPTGTNLIFWSKAWVPDKSACMSLCIDAGVDCKAIEFNAQTAACLLKNATGGDEATEPASDRWLLWNRTSFCSTKSTACTGGTLDQFAPTPGRMFTTPRPWLQARDAEHCAKICTMDGAGCAAFAFDVHTRTCARVVAQPLSHELKRIVGVTVYTKVGQDVHGCAQVTNPSSTPPAGIA